MEQFPCQIFTYESNEIRTLTGPDDELWFLAQDVCRVIGIVNHRDALSRVDDEDKDGVGITDAMGRKQISTVVNESGLYALLFSSRRPEARTFKKWVTSEILPTIRKTGHYSHPVVVKPSPAGPATTGRELALPQTYLEALRSLIQQVEVNEQLMLTTKAQEQALAEAQPKVDFFDAVSESEDLLDMNSVAKLLAVPNMGRNKIFQLLRDSKILRTNNQPYQRYVDNSSFRLIEVPFKVKNETRIQIKTVATQKGVNLIRRLLAESTAEMPLAA